MDLLRDIIFKQGPEGIGLTFNYKTKKFDVDKAKLEKCVAICREKYLIKNKNRHSKFSAEDIENEYYNTNISDYLIGYTLGIEFASNDLIHTELINNKESYNGNYFYTNDVFS